MHVRMSVAGIHTQPFLHMYIYIRVSCIYVTCKVLSDAVKQNGRQAGNYNRDVFSRMAFTVSSSVLLYRHSGV